MKLLAQYHTAACSLAGSRLHTTMQLLAYYQPAACLLPASRFHPTMQSLAQYGILNIIYIDYPVLVVPGVIGQVMSDY